MVYSSQLYYQAYISKAPHISASIERMIAVNESIEHAEMRICVSRGRPRACAPCGTPRLLLAPPSSPSPHASPRPGV